LRDGLERRLERPSYQTVAQKSLIGEELVLPAGSERPLAAEKPCSKKSGKLGSIGDLAEFAPALGTIISGMMKPAFKSLPTVTDCRGCGACCLHMGYPAFIHGSRSQPDEPHWIRLPAELKSELLAFVDAYQPPAAGELDGPCCWLDSETRLCKHHEHRPNVCRNFAVASQGCLEWRDFYQENIATGESP